jgi:hypothetical protein
MHRQGAEGAARTAEPAAVALGKSDMTRPASPRSPSARSCATCGCPRPG